MNVSDNIKAIRANKGLSQAEVARRYGTSPEFYHRLEKKDKTLTVEQLERIADSLGVTILELLGFENAGQSNEVQELQRRFEFSEKENDKLRAENKDLKREQERLNEMLGIVKAMMDLVNRNPQQVKLLENELFDGDDDKKERIKENTFKIIEENIKDQKKP